MIRLFHSGNIVLRPLLHQTALGMLLFLATACGGDSDSSDPGSTPADSTVAFAGAEGFGRQSRGGRDGRVIDVLNLDDGGAGSLRQCAEVESGPRSCVFRVAGTIDISSLRDIEIVHPFLTIDGSTAPGGGIALKGAGISVKASHVILRHLRVRPGVSSIQQRGQVANGITLRSNEGVPISDIMIDHCSVSWGTDDLVNVVFGTDNVTVQWSIFSEGLVNCGPDCGSRAFLMGLGARSVSFHHNLSAHNFIRWPEATGGGEEPGATGRLDFVNNVQYNGNGTDTIVNPVHGPLEANFTANYWKDGPDTMPGNSQNAVIRALGGLTYSAQSSLHVSGNVGRHAAPNGAVAHGFASPPGAIIWSDNGGMPVAGGAFTFPQVTTTSAEQAFEEVLAAAGAMPRDAVDQRIVDEVRAGTGHWIRDPAEVGGWPDLAS